MEICFILVEPAVPENVGSAARAIKTMGFRELRLVNPCEYLGVKALMLAHGSHDILENAKVFGTLQDALLDTDISFAATAKQRWVKQDVIGINDLKDFIGRKNESISRIAVVFGREESGLTNEEIAFCDRAVTVPLKDPFPSLNLAQAVMVFSFALSENKFTDNASQNISTNASGYKPLKNRVIDILNRVGITKKSLVHGRVLERLTEISDQDVNLLHSVTSKIVEKLDEK